VALSICSSERRNDAEEARQATRPGEQRHRTSTWKTQLASAAGVDPVGSQPITDGPSATLREPWTPSATGSHARSTTAPACLIDTASHEAFMAGDHNLRECYQDMSLLTWKTLDEARLWTWSPPTSTVNPPTKRERRPKRQALREDGLVEEEDIARTSAPTRW
jgi:hypothetical protein